MPDLAFDLDLELQRRRARMSVYRLAFRDTLRTYVWRGAPIMPLIQQTFAAADPVARERFQDVTVFERWTDEVKAYLQNPLGLVNMTDEEVDDLFETAMALEASRKIGV